MFSKSKSEKRSWSSQKGSGSRHAVSSSDSDATVDPGSDAATEPDSDATIEPDPRDFDGSQDLFSDPSDDEKESSVKMSSNLGRQSTHVISDSDSDSEPEKKSSSKHHHNSHRSSHSSDSKKSSSSGHHHERSSSHSSHRDADRHRNADRHRDGDRHSSKSHHHRSSSSKLNSDSVKKVDKSSKPSVSANGSSLFSDFLDLSSSDAATTTPAKKTSLTSTPDKSVIPKSVPTKKSSKLRDIFGSDSDDSAEDSGVGVGTNDTSMKQDPNAMVPQPLSPSPPPMSSPSPPPSPSPSSVSSPANSSEQVSPLSFDQALDFDSPVVSKIARPKSPTLSSSSSKSSIPKPSSNSVSKSESQKSEHSSRHSSSLKRESGKDVTSSSSSRRDAGKDNANSSSSKREAVKDVSSSSKRESVKDVSSSSKKDATSSSSTSSTKKEPVKDITTKSSSAVSESTPNKRKHEDSNVKSKPVCQFGTLCTRKNPLHWAEFEHFEASPEKSPEPKKPKSDDLSPSPKKPRSDDSSPSYKKSKGFDHSPSSKKPKSAEEEAASLYEKGIRKKYKEAQPYSFFLTQVKGIDDKYNSSFAIDISEILSPAFGNLQASCQFNFMIDIKWLVQQYAPELRKKPLLIVHGFTGSQLKGIQQDASKFPHVSLCQARLDIPFGTHHSKMMFLLYDNGMRVVIHTANLIHGDWHQKTQALWISPLFPRLKCGANKNEGHSPSSFKKDLVQYVAAYKNAALATWEKHLLEHDMAEAKVHLVASVPGRHTMLQKNAWGHLKLRKVLIDNGPEKYEVESWPVVGQFSSIGSLGPSADKWLCGEFYQSLASCRSSTFSPAPKAKSFRLIYPSVDNVRVSLEGYPAGTCLPYSIQTASKQSYLINYLNRWRSEGRGRTRACPHIKTYMRASPDYSMAAWFMVTSANLSKAAWGMNEKNGAQLMIRSYEIGVMFLPNLFDSRRLRLTSDVKEAVNAEKAMFLLPYDVPPTAYEPTDTPWIYDIPHKELPDTNGMMWCPTLLR